MRIIFVCNFSGVYISVDHWLFLPSSSLWRVPKKLFGMLIIGQKENVDNVSILYTALLVKIHYYDFFMLAQADHMKLIIFPSPTHLTFSIFENTIVQARPELHRPPNLPIFCHNWWFFKVCRIEDFSRPNHLMFTKWTF